MLNAMLSCTDTVQTLSLTYNNPLGNFAVDSPEKAVITLYCDDTLVGEYTRNTYYGWWLEYKPEHGKEYTIRVEVDGEPALSATTSTPDEPRISFHSISAGAQRNFVLNFYQYPFSDPFWIYNCHTYFERPYISMSSIPFLPKNTILYDEIGTNHIYADNFNLTGKEISSAGFPVKYPVHLAYIRIIPDEEFSRRGNEHVRFGFGVETIPNDGFIVFRSASREYDDYLKSSLKKALLFNEEYDISRWFDESSVYSNIENGLGIFASYSDLIYYYYPDLEQYEY